MCGAAIGARGDEAVAHPHQDGRESWHGPNFCCVLAPLNGGTVTAPTSLPPESLAEWGRSKSVVEKDKKSSFAAEGCTLPV